MNADDQMWAPPPLHEVRHVRFVATSCMRFAVASDRFFGGILTGLEIDAATVLCTIDDLASERARYWLRSLQARGPEGVGVRVTIQLERG